MKSGSMTRLLFLSLVAAAAGGAAAAACVGDDPVRPPSDGRRDPDGATTDGASNTDGAADASDGAAPRTCNVTSPFTKVEEVSELNAAQSGGARLSRDGLTVWFHRVLSADEWIIYSAKRPDKSSKFGAPAPVDGVGAGKVDAFPTVNKDGSLLFFQRSLTSTAPERDIAQLALGASGSPSPTPGLSSALQERTTYVADDGSMWLSLRDEDGGVTNRIVHAPRSGQGFGALEDLGPEKANPAMADEAPVVSTDGLTMYFATNRGAGGGLEVWFASRTSLTARFGNLKALPAIRKANSSELPTWLSPDNCELWFQRNEALDGGGTTGFGIYRALR